mmetsp:Transcript_18487/g.55193  ORF Transcript_18487/g.55193 Transcript_18487/m.55193 type:complete len:233 (+) Transcript_18487:1433-2131(+)
MTCHALKESRPVVGSSKNTMEGWVMSSTPMLTRFRSPLLIPFRECPPMGRLQQPERPSDASNSEIWSWRRPFSSSWRRCLAGKRNRAENNIASRGVSVAKNSSFCITYATLGRKSLGSTLRPLTRRSPSMRKTRLLSCRPANTFSNVLFPAPEGPNIQHTSPGFARPTVRDKMTLLPATTLMSHSSSAGCADKMDVKLPPRRAPSCSPLLPCNPFSAICLRNSCKPFCAGGS